MLSTSPTFPAETDEYVPIQLTDIVPVRVYDVHGEYFDTELQLDSPVSLLQLAIEDYFKVKPEVQLLLFNRQQIRPELSLRQNGCLLLKGDPFVKIVFSLKRGPLLNIVCTLGNTQQQYAVACEEMSTVFDVKQKLCGELAQRRDEQHATAKAQEVSVPLLNPHRLRFLWRYMELNDKATLHYYRIPTNSIIRVLRKKGGDDSGSHARTGAAETQSHRRLRSSFVAGGPHPDRVVKIPSDAYDPCEYTSDRKPTLPSTGLPTSTVHEAQQPHSIGMHSDQISYLPVAGTAAYPQGRNAAASPGDHLVHQVFDRTTANVGANSQSASATGTPYMFHPVGHETVAAPAPVAGAFGTNASPGHHPLCNQEIETLREVVLSLESEVRQLKRRDLEHQRAVNVHTGRDIETRTFITQRVQELERSLQHFHVFLQRALALIP